MKLLTDIYNRNFKSLRVSLLNRCNFSCTYCTMGEDDITEHTSIEAKHLLGTIHQLHEVLQLETIRLTGGEPLLYHDLISVIKGIKAIGIEDVKLTTNGFLLERMAKQLKDAGMQSINVSLDAMDEDVFFLMTKRSDVNRILNGIETALAVGLQVKINAVIMKGINENQLLPLVDYAFSKSITIRFLEVMAMGHLHSDPLKYLVTEDVILETIATKYAFTKMKRNDSSTANYWQTDTGNVFGIIANESEPFCQDCNRLRLDSEGNMYGCLSSNHPISLKDVSDDKTLIAKLQQAMEQKQLVKFVGSDLSMLQIGG
ncbi:GTP 3',8-cyclase MoaA [Ferruginibacter sp. SUN002]|uniref:GTP 3',8-cyclase MoaA n=1 Tax=Ferruginibacter sp. SUN002 TaxID=2937789 RepID=UPI003D35FA7A